MDFGGAIFFPFVIPFRWFAIGITIDILERTTTIEGVLSNTRHAVWDIDRGKRTASAKRTIFNTRHAVWNIDREKRVA